MTKKQKIMTLNPYYQLKIWQNDGNCCSKSKEKLVQSTEQLKNAQKSELYDFSFSKVLRRKIMKPSYYQSPKHLVKPLTLGTPSFFTDALRDLRIGQRIDQFQVDVNCQNMHLLISDLGATYPLLRVVSEKVFKKRRDSLILQNLFHRNIVVFGTFFNFFKFSHSQNPLFCLLVRFLFHIVRKGFTKVFRYIFCVPFDVAIIQFFNFGEEANLLVVSFLALVRLLAGLLLLVLRELFTKDVTNTIRHKRELLSPRIALKVLIQLELVYVFNIVLPVHMQNMSIILETVAAYLFQSCIDLWEGSLFLRLVDICNFNVVGVEASAIGELYQFDYGGCLRRNFLVNFRYNH